jgi:hypothetical protein
MVRDKLSNCKRDIQMFTRQIVSLEDDLSKQDANERRKASIASDYAVQPLEDQVRLQSAELEKTRYEKVEIENAYNSLLSQKYNLEMELQNSLMSSQVIHRTPTNKRRPPSAPRFVGSNSKFGQTIESRLQNARFGEDILRS